MIRSLNSVDEFAAAEIKDALRGRKCWHAFTSFGNTPKLVMGRKVPRSSEELAAWAELQKCRLARGRRLRAPENPDYEKFQGESELLVWCSWRLDAKGAPVTSWDNDAQRAEAGIKRLIGHTVREVVIASGWNLQLEFSGEWVLSVMPDHVGPKASFDGNWELWQPDRAYLIGTKLTCEVKDRENHAMRLQPPQGRWRVDMESKKITARRS